MAKCEGCGNEVTEELVEKEGKKVCKTCAGAGAETGGGATQPSQ